MERGQVLERMTVIASTARGDVSLEALVQPGVSREDGARGAPVVIAGMHARLGGNMDSPVAAEIVWQLARAGHPTLRFNWRGMGASTGETRVPWLPASEAWDVDDEVADLNAAVDLQGATALVGISFGCGPAARVGATHPRVDHVVLVAPPLAALPMLCGDLDALLECGARVSVLAGELDETAPPERIRAALRERVGVVVIPHAGHSFQRGLVELGRKLVDCL